LVTASPEGIDMPPDNTDFDDIVFVEQRRDIRIVASVPGRYCLDRRDSRGNRREYSCRAINISSTAIALAVPVVGKPGERVLAHIDHFGKLKGTVGRLLDRGFVMNIIATEEERSNLSAKIQWFELYKNHEVADQRENDRFVPKNPHSSLILSDGTTLGCFVLDISVSGVAVSADMVPEIGTVMAVGRVIGRVVRLFAGGFALQFTKPQDKDHIEILVIRG
jgi:hypothetical protein